MRILTMLSTLALPAFTACGALEPGAESPRDPSNPIATPEGRLLPLRIGATWTYQVTEPSRTEVAQKSSTVEALEPVGPSKPGVTAFRVRTEKLDGITVSWQEELRNAIVRHREETFDEDGRKTGEEVYVEHKLRIDESEPRTSPGASFEERYTETRTEPDTGGSKTVIKWERWRVDGLESVTVPAGTFDCLRLVRDGARGGQAQKTYWFAKGVGKVKETGNQTEELVAWTIPSNAEEER